MHTSAFADGETKGFVSYAESKRGIVDFVVSVLNITTNKSICM